MNLSRSLKKPGEGMMMAGHLKSILARIRWSTSYTEIQNLQSMMSQLTYLGIFIACMGLFEKL